MKRVYYTNGVPICPNCSRPTTRTAIGASSTCMYFPQVFNEKGENVNPDRNIYTESYLCNHCNKEFSIQSDEQDDYSIGKNLFKYRIGGNFKYKD